MSVHIIKPEDLSKFDQWARQLPAGTKFYLARCTCGELFFSLNEFIGEAICPDCIARSFGLDGHNFTAIRAKLSKSKTYHTVIFLASRPGWVQVNDGNGPIWVMLDHIWTEDQLFTAVGKVGYE